MARMVARGRTLGAMPDPKTEELQVEQVQREMAERKQQEESLRARRGAHA